MQVFIKKMNFIFKNVILIDVHLYKGDFKMINIIKYTSVAIVASMLLVGCSAQPAQQPDDIKIEVEKQVNEVLVDKEEQPKNVIANNDLFSIEFPEGVNVAYETDKNSIYVYEKDFKNTEFGGFVFDVKLYENPFDYAGGLDMKVGEITINNKLYDVVMSYASEIQWDYNEYEDMPESYKVLYDSSKDIVKNTLTGVNGEKIEWGKGTVGSELYTDIISKFKTALSENWDTEKLTKENMNDIYADIAQDEDHIKKIGFAYLDVNKDGIDELLVGELTDEYPDGVIYDVYTMENRKPLHVLSTDKDAVLVVLKSGFLEKIYQNGLENTMEIFDIEPNTSNILMQVRFKTQYKAKTEYCVAYGDDEKFEKIKESDYNERIQNFNSYEKLDFTSFFK